MFFLYDVFTYGKKKKKKIQRKQPDKYSRCQDVRRYNKKTRFPGAYGGGTYETYYFRLFFSTVLVFNFNMFSKGGFKKQSKK